MYYIEYFELTLHKETQVIVNYLLTVKSCSNGHIFLIL